ncbi:hypothetical protein [Sphingobacterium faecale]|nr:hypothetical protein [Sphingobacterium faecale]
MVGLICSNCSDPQKVKQQLPSKENLEKKAETIIAYNRNRIPVPQLLDSIDEERTTEEQLFLGEKFFCDSLNKKLLAINIAHPISNIYLIDFRETDSTAIFKDYVGYYKDGVFHGTAKYQNAFHQESFLLEYNPQLGNVSVQIGKQKENYFSISLNDFSSLLKKNTSSLIIDESDQNFKNILDSSKHKTRGFRIDIDGLPLSEQKIIHPYDYYYEAILHKDGTIDLLKNKPPQQANSRYYNEHIINQIIPREIKARKLEPMRIFNQPINTKIQLRVVFYLKHK